ncbi:hypothetical protein F2P79_001423 [Pimephales promelas]|nr:hypothetical protein F2P79_001423 [Pimephales promelas]
MEVSASQRKQPCRPREQRPSSSSAGLTDKKEDVRGLLESRMKMSVVEQEGTTPHLNRMKTTQFTCRVRKLEENLEKQQNTKGISFVPSSDTLTPT